MQRLQAPNVRQGVCHGGTSKSHSRSWDRTWRVMERAFLSMLGSTAGIHFSSISDKTVPQKSQFIQEAQSERQENSLTFEVNPQINLTIGQKGNRKGRIPHMKLCTWYRKACSFFKRMDEWKPDRQQISPCWRRGSMDGNTCILESERSSFDQASDGQAALLLRVSVFSSENVGTYVCLLELLWGLGLHTQSVVPMSPPQRQ